MWLPFISSYCCCCHRHTHTYIYSKCLMDSRKTTIYCHIILLQHPSILLATTLADHFNIRPDYIDWWCVDVIWVVLVECLNKCCLPLQLIAAFHFYFLHLANVGAVVQSVIWLVGCWGFVFNVMTAVCVISKKIYENIYIIL